MNSKAQSNNDLKRQIIIKQFCTPPIQEDSDFDRKALSGTVVREIAFENRKLKVYSSGAGRGVLLVHGWGSRASHMVLLARYLERKGFHVVLFDAPAHGNSRMVNQSDISNTFEFGRAIACVACKMDSLYAVIGHSLGALASGFVVAGTGKLLTNKISTKNLVLISAPESVSRVIENYCRNRNEMYMLKELTAELESSFGFNVSDYNLSSEVHNIPSRIMVIHDEQDEEIPVSDAQLLKDKNENVKLLLTNGFGHKRILTSREMFQSIYAFLSTDE